MIERCQNFRVIDEIIADEKSIFHLRLSIISYLFFLNSNILFISFLFKIKLTVKLGIQIHCCKEIRKPYVSLHT